MKGNLTEQPLAELIREILSKALSGTLRIEHDRVQVAIYFEDGEVVYAAANLRTLRLREYLGKRGVVSEKECESLGANLSDLGLARALRAKGKLSEKDLNPLLAAVVTDVLRVALLWTEGEWTFNARARLDEPIRVEIDTASLLKEGAQRLPLNFISLRFRNKNETFSRAAEVSRTSNILPAESFLLSRLDRPTKLEDVVALSSLPELDTYRALYGLAVSGLVEREFWQNAFRTGAVKPPAPKPAPVVPAAPVSAPEPADNRWTTVDNEEADLENFLRRLNQAVNYYEVIQLPTTAAAEEIKNAYYALARRYHPDRFHLKSGTPLHAQISSAFARITQAYETLTDASARLAYDQAMERARQFAKATAKPAPANTEADTADELAFDDASPTATESNRPEYNFREGVAALQQGRVNAAITYLATASRLAPDEARYRAHYGRALAAGDATRRLAENEIQAAVKLEPNNAVFRTMLAELYFDLKFHRRAQTEVDRALALDPDNALARSLLRKLEKSRKVG
jgi:curved DNA-binding protein CbpA